MGTSYLIATRRVRDAVRALLDAAQQSARLDTAALDILNNLSASAPSSTQIEMHGERAERLEQWYYTDPVDLTLAATARSAIDVLTIPGLRSNLRRWRQPQLQHVVYQRRRAMPVVHAEYLRQS